MLSLGVGTGRYYDKEAHDWRSKHREEILDQLKPFLDRIYRKSKSEKSKENKYVALLAFCGWKQQLPNEILEDIKAKKADPYKMLDDFVSYLSTIKAAPHTVKNYVSGAKKWLAFNDVELDNERFKNKVEMPRQYSITKDRIPTNQELRDIVYSTDARGKALIMVLASSGMRIDEVLSLRVRDVDFDKKPVTIDLRAEITKDRQARKCFISDEAVGFLKSYLEDRIGTKDAYIFQGRHQGVKADGTKFTRGEWENRPMTYWNADTILSTALKKAGLEEKDEYGRDTIHIHSLRKFFHTRLLGVLGREITEALEGHKEFLDSAYRRYTLDELGEQYLRGAEALSINKGKEDTELASIRMMVETGVLDIENDKVRAYLANKLGIPTGHPDIVRILYDRLGIHHGDIFKPEKPDPKVIAESELQKYLDDGWDIQTVLSSGKVVVRK